MSDSVLRSAAAPTADTLSAGLPDHARTGALPIAAGALAVHLAGAAVIYHRLAHDLYALFDDTPRLLVLEQGLVRLMAVSIFLPPVVPTLLVLGVAGWLGAGGRRAGGRWLGLALVPLAVDGALRAVGVALAPAPANIGELLDLPMRFSPGPRLVAELAGWHPRAGVLYWCVVCSAAALVSVNCVARALLAADEAELQPAERRRRRLVGDPIAVLQAATMAGGAFAALAFAGQVALPWATQIFLRVFG